MLQENYLILLNIQLRLNINIKLFSYIKLYKHKCMLFLIFELPIKFKSFNVF